MINDKEMLTRIASNIFKNADLGGISATKACNCMLANEEYPGSDAVTAVIVYCVNEADELSDIADNIDYAISQLKLAKQNAINASN